MGQPHDGISNACGGSTILMTDVFKTPLLRKLLYSDVLADSSAANKLKNRSKVPFMWRYLVQPLARIRNSVRKLVAMERVNVLQRVWKIPASDIFF